MSASQFTRIPILTALIIITVIFTPPFTVYGIAFSLQPLIIALIALLFDWKTTLAVVSLYILLGCIGLPIFTGGKNGITALSSGTIGFIFGFIPYSLLLSITKMYVPNKRFIALFMTLLSAFVALIVLYACGYVYFHITTGFEISTYTRIMVPFFILDCMKLLFASIVATQLTPLIQSLQK